MKHNEANQAIALRYDVEADYICCICCYRSYSKDGKELD
jgi:hypothetical protein